MTDRPQKDGVTVEALYRELRPFAFSVAYRMLGTVSDAEDTVQDAFVRLQAAGAQEIESPRAFLTTVVTRLAITRLTSARARRETYPGPWLPEPLVGAEPAADSESLSMAFLVLLESLSPVERAVFVLHDVLEYDYPQIAEIVQKSEANCRQLATRARRHVDEQRPRFHASDEQRATLARRFWEATRGGNLDGLVAMLAADAAFHGDGGGKATAFPQPIGGRDRVAKLMAGLGAKLEGAGVTMEEAWVNGQPGALWRDADGGLISVMTLDVDADGAIVAVRSVVNPDKLGHLGALSPLARRPS